MAADWLPALQGLGVHHVYFVSCGNTVDLTKWLDYTAFPAHRALLDQANALYDALATRRGVARTLLHPKMWLVLPFRRAGQGTLRGLGAAFKVWRPRVPEKNLHSFLQGGTFVLRGRRVVWSHLNATPGDEPPLEQVLQAVREELKRGGASCGRRCGGARPGSRGRRAWHCWHCALTACARGGAVRVHQHRGHHAGLAAPLQAPFCSSCGLWAEPCGAAAVDATPRMWPAPMRRRNSTSCAGGGGVRQMGGVGREVEVWS